MDTPRVFAVDTSCLIEGWNTLYPQDINPGFWEVVDEYLQAGRLISPKEVLEEIKRKDDNLKKWASARPNLFRELTDSEYADMRGILRNFPELTNPDADRDYADPFVVALAKTNGYAVLTEERMTSRRSTPRIPTVCKHYNVQCLSLLQFHRDEKIRYARKL